MSEEMHQIDARGTLCPIPVIRTQSKVRTLTPGEHLRVLASDPGALHDIPAWCRIHGHEVLNAGQRGQDYVVELRVGHPS